MKRPKKLAHLCGLICYTPAGCLVVEGANAERRRIRRELLAVGVIAEGVWVYRASVVAAIKKATRAGR